MARDTNYTLSQCKVTLTWSSSPCVSSSPAPATSILSLSGRTCPSLAFCMWSLFDSPSIYRSQLCCPGPRTHFAFAFEQVVQDRMAERDSPGAATLSTSIALCRSVQSNCVHKRNRLRLQRLAMSMVISDDGTEADVSKPPLPAKTSSFRSQRSAITRDTGSFHWSDCMVDRWFLPCGLANGQTVSPSRPRTHDPSAWVSQASAYWRMTSLWLTRQRPISS